jgi:hypothetical protein
MENQWYASYGAVIPLNIFSSVAMPTLELIKIRVTKSIANILSIDVLSILNVEKARRGHGLSTVHMAQCIVDKVAKGMDIWDYVTEILYSRAYEETDPVSSFPDISGLASIPVGDLRGTGDIAVSAGFVATGIDILADIMDMHFATPDCDGSTSDDLSVGVGFVGVTGSDTDLQDQEESTHETATETAGTQIDIAMNVLRRVFVLAPLGR